MLQKINGQQYNTREKQRAAYDNIQIKDNALWGEPKTKVTSAPKVTPKTKDEIITIKPDKPKTQPTTFTGEEHAKISNEPYYDKNITGTGLIVNGSANNEQRKIIEKYSPFFKTPIAINVVPDEKSLSFRDKETATTRR